MDNQFYEIMPEEIRENPFQLIGQDWMLITTGQPGACNAMTASWGGLGVLWGKKVSFCFIRPTRHTYSLMENSDTYSLCFFDEKYREALKLCGSKSGRDMDKIAAAGLTAAGDPTGPAYLAESKLVLICKKLYYQDLQPEQFLDPGIMKNYPGRDYHRMYAGEILRCMKK
ncbi:MAG TPA: flavin reductase [Clostridiales bacterium]|nr:flavin reductase [Clostridiales bacterium]